MPRKQHISRLQHISTLIGNSTQIRHPRVFNPLGKTYTKDGLVQVLIVGYNIELINIKVPSQRWALSSPKSFSSES